MEAFKLKVNNLKLKVYGLAFSGNSDNYKLNSFIFNSNNEIVEKNINDFGFENEEDYIQVFESDATDKNENILNNYAKDINEYMRDIVTNDRPLILSGLIIGLYKNPRWKSKNNRGCIRKHLDNNDDIDSKEIKQTIIEDISCNLEYSGINPTKAKDVKTIIKRTLISPNVVPILLVLTKLVYKVIKIFEKEHSYDVMGSFYNTFLSYTAGGDGQDLGIVLTPNHITNLMVKLLNLYSGGITQNDKVLDPTCGSGAFLISYMNFQINIFAKDNPALQEKIKNNNLIGVEINSTMFVLAVANMLVRGDGKAQLKNADFFKSLNFKNKEKESTIRFGLMNPPYSQAKKNKVKSKLTKTTTEKVINLSEMSFIERLCSKVNGFVAVIVPKSALFKNSKAFKEPKANLYKHNTLKCVISMPDDLFYGKGVHTAIAVFDTQKGHSSRDYVYFYNLKYDGFKSDKKGRKDLANKWQSIENSLLKSLKHNENIENKAILVNHVKEYDEWIPEAWLPVDYSHLMNENADQYFDKVIKEYTLFKYKEKIGLLDLILTAKNEPNKELRKELTAKLPSELELLELIQQDGLSAIKIISDEEDS